MRKTYHKDDDFHIEYVEKYNEVFLHCDVFNWKLSSLRRGIRVFAKLLNEFQVKGRSRLLTATPNPQFAEMLGGEFLQTQRGEDGKEYEVYQWVLN